MERRENYDREHEAFMEDPARFTFPGKMYRVTGGRGGEAILITGSRMNALHDCGMAYCGEETAQNVKNTLDRLADQGLIKNRALDLIIMSHSHYDHIGAIPYLRDMFPAVKVCGSRKARNVFLRSNAKSLMEELGEVARKLYAPYSTEVVRTDGLIVDKVIENREKIYLGDITLTAYETKGHTDCSMSYLVEPYNLLLTSESTGLMEGPDRIHTPVLKSFSDAMDASFVCEKLKPKYLCLPHSGMLPQAEVADYFLNFRKECYRKMDFVREMKKEGLNFDQMYQRYLDRYWTEFKEKEHPYEAFAINSRHILKALIKAVE